MSRPLCVIRALSRRAPKRPESINVPFDNRFPTAGKVTGELRNDARIFQRDARRENERGFVVVRPKVQILMQPHDSRNSISLRDAHGFGLALKFSPIRPSGVIGHAPTLNTSLQA